MSYDKIITEIQVLMDICSVENKEYLRKYRANPNDSFAQYNRRKSHDMEERFQALGECRKIVEKYAKEE